MPCAKKQRCIAAKAASCTPAACSVFVMRLQGCTSGTNLSRVFAAPPGNCPLESTQAAQPNQLTHSCHCYSCCRCGCCCPCCHCCLACMLQLLDDQAIALQQTCTQQLRTVAVEPCSLQQQHSAECSGCSRHTDVAATAAAAAASAAVALLSVGVVCT